MESDVTYAHVKFPMDSDVTYAQLKLPPAAQEKTARKKDLVMATVTTPGKTPATSSAHTTSRRALGLLSCMLLVIIITLAVYCTTWSAQLQRKTVEVRWWSANASLMSESLVQLSKKLDISQKNFTHLLLSYEAITRQNAQLSASLQSTNESLQELQKQQKQAVEQSERSWQRLQQWNQFQCSKDQMPVMSCWSCQQGWITHNKRCYYFSQDDRTWGLSKDKCASLQSQLVSVNSQEEQVFILIMLEGGTNRYWIGYTDSEKENQWIWADGSSNQLFWSDKQPDNFQEQEHCATTQKLWSLRTWNDDNCKANHRYICEKAADRELFRVTGALDWR